MWSKLLAAGLSCVALVSEGVRHRRTALGRISGVRVHKDSSSAEDFLILFRRGASDAMIKALCQGQCVSEGHPSRGGVAFAKVHGRDVVEKLLAGPAAQFVELVEADGMDFLPPDENVADDVGVMSTSWGLGRVGVPGRAFTGAGTTIFIQDTGVRKTHSDFGGRVTPTIDLTTGQGIEVCAESGSSTCARDGQGHGTHCAGTAAGATYGVAPGAEIRAVKTLSDSGSGARSWQMEAIDWIASTEIRPAVLSMSLGGSGADPSYVTSIGAATEAGVTVVVAGGNSNSDACNFSPAFVQSAITVGSTTSLDERSSFSNYGPCTQIWAPGSSIRSASQLSDDGSSVKSGTSMACPHVAGGVALLLEEDPSLQGSAVLQVLYSRGEVGALSDLKAGDTNVLLWVSADAAPVPAPTPEPTTPPNFVCNDGCDIRDDYRDDGYCDCTECEDEAGYTCSTCSGGCPTFCGSFKSCR